MWPRRRRQWQQRRLLFRSLRGVWLSCSKKVVRHNVDGAERTGGASLGESGLWRVDKSKDIKHCTSREWGSMVGRKRNGSTESTVAQSGKQINYGYLRWERISRRDILTSGASLP
jgi:hypothetical protein